MAVRGVTPHVAAPHLLTFFLRSAWNPAHDCVNRENRRDVSEVALCDIAPPPQRIAPQGLSINLE
jgi:hypothetical protein